MRWKDGYHEAAAVVLLAPASISATTQSNYVDRQGFDLVELEIVSAMTTADGTNYMTPTVQEATATPASAGSYSTTTELLGDTLAARNAVATVIQRVVYTGTARYVNVKVTETLTAEGGWCVIARLYRARKHPGSGITPTTGTVT